jgi:hypothetical protein
MTVSALYEPDVYNGNGTLDTFPVTFNYLNDSTYLKVSLKNEITLTYTLCYEHLQYEMSGDNVVFNVGYIPTVNDTVIIEFNSDWLQNSDYVENSALPAENMETDFDKLKLEVQALRDSVGRALRVGPEVDIDIVDTRDYFEIGMSDEVQALVDVSTDLLDIADNWTPASSSGGASLRFKEDSDNGSSGIYIKAPASLAADVTLTLPTTDGDADQLLKTDGSGNLSWSSTLPLESGTWTPTLEGSISNPTVAYTTRNGRYKRFGDFVLLSFEILTSSISGGSGNLLIKSLPIVPNDVSYYSGLFVGFSLVPISYVVHSDGYIALHNERVYALISDINSQEVLLRGTAWYTVS